MVVAWLAWTAFVWVGRVRNALADQALDAGGRVGPLLLSLSFLVPTVVLAVWLARTWGRPAGRGLRLAVGAFAGWTVGVWVLRVGDIALGGDHAAGFVVVHTVLGVVSAVLAVASVRALARPLPTAVGGPVTD